MPAMKRAETAATAPLLDETVAEVRYGEIWEKAHGAASPGAGAGQGGG
ncbi:MAG: hypothetical protein NTW87_01125 [Planctomycetota bacterium]|nr:hypothetical protein [Planctomycetota bacterium]